MSVLERLAAKYPLAIVTGRPRKPDCETALKVFGLSKLFKVVVCMEDAPVKPDPAPVRKIRLQIWGLGFRLRLRIPMRKAASTSFGLLLEVWVSCIGFLGFRCVRYRHWHPCRWE